MILKYCRLLISRFNDRWQLYMIYISNVHLFEFTFVGTVCTPTFLIKLLHMVLTYFIHFQDCLRSRMDIQLTKQSNQNNFHVDTINDTLKKALCRPLLLGCNIALLF